MESKKFKKVKLGGRKRGGFTLLEILISTLLLLFLFVVMGNVLKSLGRGAKLLSSKVENRDTFLINLLYYDLFNADKIEVHPTSNPQIDTLLLHTRNSLYQIPFPYVKWVVKRGRLYRLESPTGWNSPLPFTIDQISPKISTFKLYSQGNRYLIFANSRFFEMEVFNPRWGKNSPHRKEEMEKRGEKSKKDKKALTNLKFIFR
jgi:type II secretory pathway pseudopilin PulG